MTFKRFTLLAILAVLLTLTSCAEYDRASEHLKMEGARATDAFLETSEYGICSASTIGAIMRRYGSNPDAADAWQIFCEEVWKQQAGQELELFKK